MLMWKEADARHGILGLNGKNDKGQYILQWNFFDADCFLVVEKKYEKITMENLEGIINNKLHGKIESLLQFGNVIEENLKIFLVNKPKFLANNNKYVVASSHMMKGIVQFLVFSCVRKENELTVFYPESVESCSVLKKIKITIEPIEKNGFLGFVKHKFILQIPYIEGYEDYDLCYKVSNLPYYYPITREMMNKSIAITVPKNESVEVKVSEKGREIYQLR